VASQGLLGEDEEIHEKPQDNRCSGIDSNRVPPEYKCTSSPLHQPVQYVRSVLMTCHVKSVLVFGCW
jgi:hypothetical protein